MKNVLYLHCDRPKPIIRTGTFIAEFLCNGYKVLKTAWIRIFTVDRDGDFTRWALGLPGPLVMSPLCASLPDPRH